MPTRRLFGLFAKAWDLYEVVEFVKTGEVEHLGAPLASVAKKVADWGAEAIEEGATTRFAIGAKVGGRVYLVAWTTYEAFKLGASLREMMDARDEAEGLARDQWHWAMNGHVWNPYVAELAAERAQMFDDLLADNLSHGQAPGLTPDAQEEFNTIVRDATDAWKEQLRIWHAAAQLLAQGGDNDTPSRVWIGQRHEITIEGSPKEVIEDVVAGLAETFARLRALSNDPANWLLNREQMDIVERSGQAGPWHPSEASKWSGWPQR